MTTTLDTQPGISPAPAVYSGPSIVRDGEILARGVPIGELVEACPYIDMLFVQLQGREPTHNERAMLNAYLVSLCEHGVTSPSTHGPRVTSSVRAPFAASGERVWGYGHRFHKSAAEPGESNAGNVQEDADPRVRALIALADDLGWGGEHLRRVRSIGRALHARKRIPINIDGVAAGLLLDMGFRPETALLFVMIGRLPNIARLHTEEQDETANRFTALATRDDSGFDRTVDRDQHPIRESERAGGARGRAQRGTGAVR